MKYLGKSEEKRKKSREKRKNKGAPGKLKRVLVFGKKFVNEGAAPIPYISNKKIFQEVKNSDIRLLDIDNKGLLSHFLVIIVKNDAFM